MPRKTVRLGATTSNKQLARTVVDGRLVTFHLPGGLEPITGYVCGMDDFHWMVVTGTLEKHLIHKGAAPLITLSDESTFASEHDRESLEGVVGPFRRWVEAEFFGRSPVASASV